MDKTPNNPPPRWLANAYAENAGNGPSPALDGEILPPEFDSVQAAVDELFRVAGDKVPSPLRATQMITLTALRR